MRHLKRHPYQLAVKAFIHAEEASNRVDPELVSSVTPQDGVGDS